MRKRPHKRKKSAAYLKSVCSECAHCCIDTIVPISDRDVKRLMQSTGKKADDIVRMYDGSEIDYEHDRDGWVHFSYGKRIMGLKKKNERCQFLASNNLCTVYQSRPRTCHSFPYDVDLDEKGKVTSITINKGVVCYLKVGDVPVKECVENVKNEEAEDERYYKKLRKWNKSKRKGGKQAFLQFIGLA